MSFMATTEQILNQTKTVTRRVGWKNLKPGEMIQPVYKSQGLKKGETVKKLGNPVRVIRVERIPLDVIDDCDLIFEGFPDLTHDEFIEMFMKMNKGCDRNSIVTRIEFEYIPSVEDFAKLILSHTDNESNDRPYWFIAKRTPEGVLMLSLGIWFNREDAEYHLEKKRYWYDDDAFVYSKSGNDSSHYKRLYDMAKKVLANKTKEKS